MQDTVWTIFRWRADAAPLIPIAYDPWLVALSVLVASLGGIAALQLTAVGRHPERFGKRVAGTARILAALALGVSVWSMHFIGMLAVDVCQPVRFEPWLTAASMLPSVLASAAGLHVLSRPTADGRLGARRIVLAGLMVGAGIGAMHYSGMAAMRVGSLLRFDPLWVALSVLVAVALATAGLAARELLRRHTRLPRLAVLLVAGTLLGLATSGMHYTAMQASLFIGEPDVYYVPWSDRDIRLALSVAGTAILVFGFAGGMLAIVTYRALALRLREREALLSDILDNLPGAVLRLSTATPRQRILVSPALAELTGRTVRSFELGEWELADVVHADDRSALQEKLDLALRTGTRQRIVVRLRHASEEWRWVVVLAVGRRPAVTSNAPQPVLDVFIADITAQHEARARERTLSAAIDRVVGRAVLTPEGYFVEVNEVLSGVLGYRPEELVGRHHRSVWVDDAQAGEMGAFWEALRRGVAQPGEFVRRAKDGSLRHLTAWYQPLLDADGRVQSVLKLAFDVTERVQTVQTLQRAQRELEQALASRSAFFANVSHEIRTPMNAIVGFAELLREKLPPGVEREQAQTIVDAARALLRILNDLLDAAKLERGEFEIVAAPFRLDRLLQSLISHYGVLAAQKKLQLRCDSEPGLAKCWLGDGDRIRQILANLLSNALKFTEHGSVTLSAEQVDGRLCFTVQDTGIGIPRDRQQAIFDPFVQAEAGTARRYGGTGLGMSIVKRLVESMGGTVTLESEPGRGTRVRVELPLEPREPCECGNEADAGDAVPEVAPRRVLAADDVAQNRDLLAALLARAGHASHVVADGATLLAAYQAEPLAWDVVLLDLHMPEVDGLQTCQRLRAFEAANELPPVPVYALTASVLESDRAAARAAGMDGFLEKPIDPRALQRALRDAGRQRSGDAVGAPTRVSVAGSREATPVVDPDLGQRLWGDQWLPRVRQWYEEEAPRWRQAAQWGRADWHRLAGVAANLALPALAAAARDCERACGAGLAPPLAAAQHAWEACADWIEARVPPQEGGPPAPEVGFAPLPGALRERLHRACERGEIDEEALAQVERIDAAFARRLRASLDAFDFDGAQRLLTQRARELTTQES
jgi:PAS domain S-box-containing protein